MSGTGALLGVFAGLCAAGPALAWGLPQRRRPAALAAVGAAASTAIALAGTTVLVSGESFELRLWSILSLGPLVLAMDRLAALFALVTGLVFLPVSIFSEGYLRKYAPGYDLRYFSACFYAFLASLVLALLAHDAFLLLLAWEGMSITSYLLVSFESRREESASAAFLMLAMSEAGTIALVLAFAILVNAAGRLDFDSLRSASPALIGGPGLAAFALSFLGFGLKAGLVPLSSWLPRAHPVAPTNVSALLSGAMVNLGIYGIIRVDADLMPLTDVGRGLLVLSIGSVSALVGILYATIQTDLKRLLAHSTIENMGIVTAAIGAGMVFAAAGHPILAAIAFVSGLYHMMNHALYKTLLFIGCGAVEAGAGTRDLDRLGGILHRMPWTGLLFLVGILSIAALPPFNGFVSEWLTLQSVLRSAVLPSGGAQMVFALAGAALALTAGLAVTCFVKAYAMGFLGVARSAGAAAAAEAPRATRLPMAGLALLCFLLGVLPTAVIPAIDRAVTPIVRASASEALVPPFFDPEAVREERLDPAFLAEFHDLGARLGSGAVPTNGLVVLHRGGERNPVVFAMSTSYAVLMLALLLGATWAAFHWLGLRRSVATGPAWDGGLRRLRAATTYTATGFSNPVRVIFHSLLRPGTVEDTTRATADHFRTAVRRRYHEVHLVDRLVLWPTVAAIRRLATTVRRMHLGHVNTYAAYVLITLLAALVLGYGEVLVIRLMAGLGIHVQ